MSQLSSFDAKARIAERVWFLFYVRFLLYYRYLRERTGDFRYVMLTDLRDVIFQDNPFDQLSGEGVWAFEEDGSKTIGSCVTNTSMVREAVGNNNLLKIADKPISCAGVTLGSAREITGYLKAFCIASFDAENLQTCSGSDQGMHNCLIHTGKVASLKLINNETGPVYTMGAVTAHSYLMDPVVGLKRVNQSFPAVLHQYDRHKSVADGLLAKLGLGTPGTPK